MRDFRPLNPSNPLTLKQDLKEHSDSITLDHKEMQVKRKAVHEGANWNTHNCLWNEAVTVNEEDLSLKKLEEWKDQGYRLNREVIRRFWKTTT